MIGEESVAIVLKVKDMALELRKARQQRDQLREALENLLGESEASDCVHYSPAAEQARAALEEMEDGV